MFAQSVGSPSYRVIKMCDFDFVNKVIINNRRSVSVCRKVRKSVLVSVSTNVCHASTPDVVNVTIVPPYQHFNSTKKVSKSVLIVSAVSFIPAPTLAVNPAMSSCVRNILVCVNTTCLVRKVAPSIPLSVNTSTTLVNYVSHKVRHVPRPKCVFFKSRVSDVSNFKYFSSSPLYKILVAILFNTFSFTHPRKAILVRNIFSIIALSLLVYVRLYTKNGGRLIPV